MELALVIYLIGVAGVFNLDVIFFTLALSALLILMYVLLMADVKTDEEWSEGLFALIKKLVAANVMVAALVILTPDKETSYAMLATYGVQTVAESEQVQEVAGKSLRVLEKYMDEYLDESPDSSEE